MAGQDALTGPGSAHLTYESPGAQPWSCTLQLTTSQVRPEKKPPLPMPPEGPPETTPKIHRKLPTRAFIREPDETAHVFVHDDRLRPVLKYSLDFDDEDAVLIAQVAVEAAFVGLPPKSVIAGQRHDEDGPRWFAHHHPDTGAQIYVRESQHPGTLHYVRLNTVSLANALNVPYFEHVVTPSTSMPLRTGTDKRPGVLDLLDAALPRAGTPNVTLAYEGPRRRGTPADAVRAGLHFSTKDASWSTQAVLPLRDLLNLPRAAAGRPGPLKLRVTTQGDALPVIQQNGDLYFHITDLRNHLGHALPLHLNATYCRVPDAAATELHRLAQALAGAAQETP